MKQELLLWIAIGCKYLYYSCCEGILQFGPNIDKSIVISFLGNRYSPVFLHRCHRFLSAIAGLQLTSRQPCWGTTTKRFPPLGTKLFYHANSAKKFFIVLTTNMAALSRGCKRSIDTVRRLIPIGFVTDFNTIDYAWVQCR